MEKIHDDSRRLARTMFLKSRTEAGIRDLLIKFCSLDRLAGSIEDAFDEPM